MFTDERSAKNGLTHRKWKNVLHRAGIETLMAEGSVNTTGELNGRKVKYWLSAELTNLPAMTVEAYCHPPMSLKEENHPDNQLGVAQMVWTATSPMTRLMMLMLKEGKENFVTEPLDEIIGQHDPWDWILPAERHSE